MSVSLLPLCSIGKVAIRDGMTGGEARLMLPAYTYGYWFASGQQYTFPTGEIGQDMRMTTAATAQANTFVKDAMVCLNP